jgi:hypothetical protein
VWHNVRKVIVGRVIGVATSPLGGLLAPSLDWENEDAGNAAFDPGEYLDTLIAAGYRPYVQYDRAGHPHYGESFPEDPETEAEEDAVFDARTKFSKASLAVDLVKAECIRRGLVD